MVVTHAGIRVLSRLASASMLAFILMASSLASEVILSSENLNETLKQMQRIQQGMENAGPDARADALYQLGMHARDLAALLSEEVALYDSQQGGLIQLALDRTKQLGLNLDWFAGKQRFIYDGKAFAEYVQIAPDGIHAGESAYWLLETEFVRAVTDDPAALKLAAEHKGEYLQRFPQHANAPEVGILLAIDYRDLWRLYRSGSDAENAALYRGQTLNQFRRVIEQYAGAKQAKIAQGLLARFETEFRDSADKTDPQPAEK